MKINLIICAFVHLHFINFKRKIWTWIGIRTRTSRSLVWRYATELSWFLFQFTFKLSSWNATFKRFYDPWHCWQTLKTHFFKAPTVGLNIYTINWNTRKKSHQQIKTPQLKTLSHVLSPSFILDLYLQRNIKPNQVSRWSVTDEYMNNEISRQSTILKVYLIWKTSKNLGIEPHPKSTEFF